jgi:Kdo2-lipid IVA lauroyltransferase/acyltransferase
MSSSSPELSPVTDKLLRVPLYRFLAPRYWAIWLALALVFLISRMPYRVAMWVGRRLGDFGHAISRRDKRIADINIRLCLPGLDEAKRRQLIREHFRSLGCTLFETAYVWWARDAWLRTIVRIEGAEHLTKALQRGRGALLLSAHFTTLELGAKSLTMLAPTSLMYMTPKNPLIAEMSRRGRSRQAVQAVAADQIRELLQNLKNNVPVWYAPDQRYVDKNSAVVPLFGHPAWSNIATSRLARISKATVLPYFPERLADGSGYLMRILPPFDNYPSDDPVVDTARFHKLIEEHVMRCPAQYLWTYKRFKSVDVDPYKET